MASYSSRLIIEKKVLKLSLIIFRRAGQAIQAHFLEAPWLR